VRLINLKNKTSRWLAALGVVVAVAVSSMASAHHSAVAFDLQKPHVSVTGKVLQFIWRSPHTSINLEVTNDKGEVEIWKWEGAGTVALVKSGVTRETITPGLVLTVTGNPLRDGSPGGLMRAIKFADGKVIDFGEAATQ
jgi:hypothetical protein